MNVDFTSFLGELWRTKPSLIILFAAGVIVFVLLIVDTHRHRKKQKSRHKTKLH